MVTRDKWLAMLVGVTLYCAVGCAVSTNFNEGGHPPPDDWSFAALRDSNGCFLMEGSYQNLGLGRLARDEPMVQMRLDVALGHFSSSNKVPESVSILLNRDTNMLRYRLGHPDNRDFIVSATCSDEWYVVEKTLANHYVGDGANLDYSNRDIELGRTADGGLVVHIKLDTQFSSFAILKSRETREIWAKFEPFESQDK